MTKPKAKIISKKRVYDGFFKLDECEIEMDKHGGGKQTIKRLVLERGHAVAIMGYDPVRDKVLLTNEMRPGPLAAGDYPFYDSLPAGGIGKGESVLKAAKREMREETSMTLKDAVVIHSGAYVSAGGTSERMALVFGIIDSSKAGGVHGEAGEGEDIKTVLVTSKEFIRRAETGAVKDMKSLAAAFWLAQNKSRIRKKYVTGVKKKPGLRA
jgi:ADP-ribose pyrophosphatase